MKERIRVYQLDPGQRQGNTHERGFVERHVRRIVLREVQHVSTVVKTRTVDAIQVGGVWCVVHEPLFANEKPYRRVLLLGEVPLPRDMKK